MHVARRVNITQEIILMFLYSKDVLLNRIEHVCYDADVFINGCF